MALLDMQAALARIYLDVAARERLRRGDRSVADEFQLNPVEYDHLRRLVLDSADGLEMFARTLVRKRDERVSTFYPLLRSYLGDDRWRQRVQRYCEVHPIPPASPAADASDFARFLSSEAATDGRDVGIVSDLLMFEGTKADVADAALPPRPATVHSGPPEEVRPRLMPPARIRTMRFRPSQLTDWIARGAPTPMALTEAHVSVLFFRGPEGAAASELGPWLGVMLERADGTASLGDLITSLGAGGAEASAPLYAVLQDLSRSGIVELKSKGDPW